MLLCLSLLLPSSPPCNPSRAAWLLHPMPRSHPAPRPLRRRTALLPCRIRPQLVVRCCYVPCPIPRPHRRAAGVLPTPLFTTRRSWPLLTPWPPRHAISARRYCDESARCKRMFQVFQTFQRYVAIASYECCKRRWGCCKCFRGMLRVFQRFVQNISSVPDVRCKCSDLDVTYISHICCNYMFQVF